MPSDSKIAAPLDPAVLAERFQALATKSQAAVQGFLVIGQTSPISAWAIRPRSVKPSLS